MTSEKIDLFSSIYKPLLILLVSKLLFLFCFIIGRNYPDISTMKEIYLFSPKNASFVIESATYYGDFGWYKSLAAEGYSQKAFSLSSQANWAFFPLFSWVSLLIPNAVAQFWFGILCAALSVIFSYRLSRKFLNENSSLFVVFVISFWPSSFIISQFRPEAIQFLLTCISIFSILNGWVIASAITATLLGFVKPNGFLVFLLLPPLLIYVRGGYSRIQTRTCVECCILAVLCFLGPAFMTYVSWSHSGEPFAWSKIQSAWGASLERPIIQLQQLFTAPLITGRWGWDFEIVNWFATFMSIASIYLLWNNKFYAFSAFIFIYSAMTFLNFGNWAFSKHLGAMVLFLFSFGLISNIVLRNFILCSICILMAIVALLGGAGYIPAMG